MIPTYRVINQATALRVYWQREVGLPIGRAMELESGYFDNMIHDRQDKIIREILKVEE